MGVRPPADDVDDEPASMEFGIAALDARIENRDVSFPVAAGELEAAYGDMQIAVDPSGSKMSFDTVLERCDREEFNSKQDLLNELHPVFEAERERRSGSIVGRIRAFMPF
jgi:hypothetical protein